jgi:hypothetical protein
MKRLKSNRRSIEPKKFRSIVKADKKIINRTRKYIKVEDSNRKWEDQNALKDLIPNIASSQIKGLSATRNELIKQQKEASIALQQVTAEYNDLERQYKNREKNAKIEIENKRKLEDLKIRYKELDEHFKGQRQRNIDLGDYEKTVKQWEEQIKTDEFNEQISKEKEDMQIRIRSLQRQSNLAKERIDRRSIRTALLQDLTKHETEASEAKKQMEEQQETYKYAKQREKLIRETNLANVKAREYEYLTVAQNEHMEAMKQMEEQQAKYEMNKKLWEEKEKTEILKRETEKMKFYDNEQEMNEYQNKMMNLAKEQGKAEHDKLKYSSSSLCLVFKSSNLRLFSISTLAFFFSFYIFVPNHYILLLSVEVQLKLLFVV